MTPRRRRRWAEAARTVALGVAAWAGLAWLAGGPRAAAVAATSLVGVIAAVGAVLWGIVVWVEARTGCPYMDDLARYDLPPDDLPPSHVRLVDRRDA